VLRIANGQVTCKTVIEAFEREGATRGHQPLLAVQAFGREVVELGTSGR
jgi:hypothetical protein